VFVLIVKEKTTILQKLFTHPHVDPNLSAVIFSMAPKTNF